MDEQQEDRLRRELAERIADGHAWSEHRHDFRHCKDPEAFARYLEAVLARPDGHKRLRAGRQAYRHDKLGIVLITDSGDQDGGTAFAPKGDFEAYWNGLR